MNPPIDRTEASDHSVLTEQREDASVGKVHEYLERRLKTSA